MVAIREHLPLTVERLKELLHYDPETGVWTWIKARGRCKKGSVAGTLLDGYIMIYIDKVGYLAHRLACFYMTGEWPIEVDHENTIKNDNIWLNLREATRSQNKFNTPALSNNASGFKGVFFQKGTFNAKIMVDGEVIWLGCYGTPEEAALAYQKKALELQKEFAHSSIRSASSS